MRFQIVADTDTNMEAEAPCSVPGDISRAVAGAGRGNYQAAVQEDQEGRGQGRSRQECRLSRHRAHWWGPGPWDGNTVLHIAPLWSPAIIIVSVSCFIMM